MIRALPTDKMRQDEEQGWLTCMRSAFAEGEACALRHFRNQERKGDLAVQAKEDLSPVTLADRETEQALFRVVRSFYPQASLLGEETGESLSSSDGGLWIVDPIDGTRGFIAGWPLFGILLARLDATGKPRVGGVSMPALGCRRFFAISSGGCWEEDAQPNKQPNKQQEMATSSCERLEEARLFIGEAERTLLYDAVRALAARVRACRYAHDCYMYVRLAAGGVDVIVEAGLQAYDFMPLILLVEQAGGVVSDWQGKPLTRHSHGEVVASANIGLHRQVLACMDSCL